MTLEKAIEVAQELGLFASENRIGYGPVTCELHDSDGWLIASGDDWDIAFNKANDKRKINPINELLKAVHIVHGSSEIICPDCGEPFTPDHGDCTD